MGNFCNPIKYIEFNLNIDQNSQTECEFKITNPSENKKTKNLISEDKEIPILNGYRVDQIYPKKLAEIFSLMEYNYDRENYKKYKALTRAVIDREENHTIFIGIERSKYKYFQKLIKYIENLKENNNFEDFKQKYENRKYELRTVKFYHGAYLYRFSYPYFKEVDK